MNDNSKFKLGLFIILATAVFFAALFILGTMDRFKEKAHISTLVSESVQGLSVGSSVKYQGVPIGNVCEIMIYPTDNVIRIDMEINISKFKVQQANHAPVTIPIETFNEHVAEAVKKSRDHTVFYPAPRRADDYPGLSETQRAGKFTVTKSKTFQVVLRITEQRSAHEIRNPCLETV